jgi:Tfp pilus assembly protein PilV
MTLLELIVAVVVLSIGAIGALKAMDQSRRALGAAMPRMLAQIAATNHAETLRLAAVTNSRLPATTQMAHHRVSLSEVRKETASGIIEVEITAQINGGPGAILVTFLPAIGGVQQ